MWHLSQVDILIVASLVTGETGRDHSTIGDLVGNMQPPDFSSTVTVCDGELYTAPFAQCNHGTSDRLQTL